MKEELQKKHFDAIFNDTGLQPGITLAAAACTTITLQAVAKVLEELKGEFITERNLAHIYCFEAEKQTYNNCINMVDGKLTEYTDLINQSQKQINQSWNRTIAHIAK